MRALHLLGLPPDDSLGRFRVPDSAPLVLPGFIPRADQEVVIALFHEIANTAKRCRGTTDDESPFRGCG